MFLFCFLPLEKLLRNIPNGTWAYIRIRMLEILNNEGFSPPIIVFVNQKKTADMVCKDLKRGGVSMHAVTPFFFSVL